MARVPLSQVAVATTTDGGGNKIPAAAFDFTGAECGSSIGVSDAGYVKRGWDEALCIDGKLPFAAQTPQTLQYMDTSAILNRQAEAGSVNGDSGLPVLRKIVSPTNGARQVCEWRVGTRDLPNTNNGTVDTSDAKRTEVSSNTYVRVGDIIQVAWLEYIPSADGIKTAVAGDRLNTFQIHDIGLGSGLGPCLSFELDGAVARNFQIISSDNVTPTNEFVRDVWSQAWASIPTNAWQLHIIEARLGWQASQSPYTKVWTGVPGSVVQIVDDTEPNYFRNDSNLLTGHHIKMGLYYYNQAAASWTASRVFRHLTDGFRVWINSGYTVAQIQAFEQSLL